MRYLFYILICIAAFSCRQKKDEPETVIPEKPAIALSPLEASIKAAILEIEKKDLESLGNTVNTLDISGIEIVKLSKKEYFMEEKRSQETGFKNFLKRIEVMSPQEKALYTPEKMKLNRSKHEAVINYLDQMIKNASSDKEIYKVTYNLKTNTKMAKYDELQTTYLDKDLKKMVTDYRNLKITM